MERENEEIVSPHVTFEELEEMNAGTTARDPEQIKFEGDDVPEEIRDKSAAEIAKQIRDLHESVRISEQARMALANSQEALATVRSQPVAAPVAPPAPQDEALNMEELNELYNSNPMAAFQRLTEFNARQTEKRLEQKFGARMGSLSSASASAAELTARQQYAEVFEILGPEIEMIKENLPDKSVLADPKAWKQIVDYARGANFDKFVEKKEAKNRAAQLASAQSNASNSAAPNFSRNGASSGPRPANGKLVLDETMKRICEVQGITEEQFRKNYTPPAR